jgi:hypothetical protein
MSLNLSTITAALTDLSATHVSMGAGCFFRFDQEFSEIMGSPSMAGKTVMLMQPVSSYLTGQNEAQPYKHVRVEFSILAPTIVGNYSENETDINACEQIGLDVLARIRHFSQNFNNSPTIFQTFDFNTVQGFPILLSDDNRAGYSYQFELYEFVDLSLDETRWV